MLPTYRKMPLLVQIYLNWKGSNAWMTLPPGIFVDEGRWGVHLNPEWEWLRKHEEAHWARQSNRPYLSRWWLCIKYTFNWEMRYEEEMLAIKEEVLSLPPEERYNQMWRESWNLVRSYNIPMSQNAIFLEMQKWTFPTSV